MNRTGIPTHDDAQLVLRLYELRRDDKLREARDWFNGTFLPASMDEIREVIQGRTRESTYFRMVVSYWDMAASFVEYGVMNGEMFLESSGEHVAGLGQDRAVHPTDPPGNGLAGLPG